MVRATVFVVCLTLTAAAAAAAAVAGHDGGDLLDRVLDRCSPGPGAVRCMKTNVLDYLEGGRSAAGRSLDGDNANDDVDDDDRIVRAASAYIESSGRGMDESSPQQQQQQMQQMQQMQQQQQAAMTTTTTTARGLDFLTIIEFMKVVKSVFKFTQSLNKLKESELKLAFKPFVADMEMGMMQDKMLMPLMMMMKMKMKMLMPIMMAMVSMKATKALVLSKVAIFMVLGFLIKEFMKKSGGLPGLPMIHLPGLSGASSEPPSTAGPPMYGPPQSSGYEAPSSWEPTGYSSPSSSHHSSSDSGSHSMAYSSYLPSSSSSGSSASLSASKY